MIEVHELRKNYGERTVLGGITASFAKGQVVALVGPSGGGKSTLLRCLNGLESFDGGQVTLGGDAELELVDSLDPFSEGIVFRLSPPPTTHPAHAHKHG